MVFPWVDEGERQVLETIRAQKTEYAGVGFLKLMRYLRTVILQDSVVLMNNPVFANNPLFKNPLFTTDLFLSFKSQLEVFLKEGSVPRNVQLERVWSFRVCF